MNIDIGDRSLVKTSSYCTIYSALTWMFLYRSATCNKGATNENAIECVKSD